MTISTRGVNDSPEGSGSITGSEEGSQRSEQENTNDVEPDFPHAKLAELDLKISCPRWVVPVLPEQELECLLQASIDLCKKGLDTRSEACQRFFREGLTISFTKILTDEAVNSWKQNIQVYIYQNCQKLVELCVVKLNQDWLPLLDLLAMLFNPTNKFHTFNSTRPSETAPPGGTFHEEEIFARPVDSRFPRGWLVDLINKFGALGGFRILHERFQNGTNLSVAVMYALLRPFGLCYELLTIHTIKKYLMPVVDIILQVLESLTDEELKKEAKNESKNDAISCIIRVAKRIVSRVPGKEETSKELEILRLKMILRLLQISSFNGKMNALNEVNKVIVALTSYTPLEEEEWLNAERMLKWIKENQVLEIVLRDSLHQPQYVEKLEKILRFIIKEKSLTLEDLDAVWAAQAGKHEAIVKNVHDLLAKLAWDFSPVQLDHLFECFQSSWTNANKNNANKKQREKLLELIRRLAEDDKDGVMAQKVLTLFWNLALSDDVPTEIMEQVLAAHIKILDYSCSQERDAQKNNWLNMCVEELKSGEKWALPALRQIREICCLYDQSPNANHSQRTHNTYYRQEVIGHLQNIHGLVLLVSNSLEKYIDNVRKLVAQHPELDSATFCPDKRYCHELQVQERLNFLRFLLKDGQLWLCLDQAKQIWKCLAEGGVFPSDREACFKWFSKLMGDEPDLDPAIYKAFFEDDVLQLDPILLTESGMKCFERFFKTVNTREKKLIHKRRSILMNDPDLIGMDYLWRVITNSGEEIANRAIEIMKEVSTNLGPHLTSNIYGFHESYIAECLDRLRTHYDNVKVLMKEDLVNGKDQEEATRMMNRLKDEAVRMCRVMKVLHEYISECDGDFINERKILPLHRACRGENISLIIRFSHPQRVPDDIEINTHANDTLASLRRTILRRIKVGAAVKVELMVNCESREPIILADDRKLLSQLPIRDKMVLTAKLCQANSNTASSPESSSDSSASSPQHPYDGPNLEAENVLPGVLMSRKSECAKFFFQLSDLGCELHYPPLRDGARSLLQLIPPDQATVAKLQQLFQSHANNEHSAENNLTVESVFFDNSCTQVLYYIEVMYSLLMPALDPLCSSTLEFQYNFIKSGDAPIILEMLTKNNFLPNADVATKRAAYVTVLKMCKLLLTIIGHVLALLVFDETSMQSHEQGGPEGNPSLFQNPTNHRSPNVLRHAINIVFNQEVEQMMRNVSAKLANRIADQLKRESNAIQMFRSALCWELPDSNTIRAVMRLAWAASTGSLSCLHSPQELHNAHLQGEIPDSDDVIMCREALQVLTLSLVLNYKTMDSFMEDQLWHTFIIDLLLLSKHRAVRNASAEQFLLMSWVGASTQQPLQFYISLLFTHLNTTVIEHCKNSNEYFKLLCRLINYALNANCPLPTAETLLNNEIAWLKKIRENVKETGDPQVDEAVLEGHLGVVKELLGFLTPEKKYLLGSNEKKGICLIKELVEDFIFPASKLMLRNPGEMITENAIPVCSTPATINAAFDVIVTLCVGCVPNMKLLVHMLTEMFYSEREKPLTEWDYMPPVGPRPLKEFCGLKNAGATCYMNSVLQQLYMVESIRIGLLATEGAATDLNEDFSGEERLEGEGNIDLDQSEAEMEEEKNGKGESRKEYNIGILKQVQAIFGHLAYSEMQYYVPRGLWKHFKLQGEPVNPREQQDAVEFFTRLVESLDEALKALGQEQIMSKILGGSYSDQKICKGCPHRYSKEEPFSVINVDIRNHSTLLDSLEQYVKGELLEGADAYHCDKCNKKVVTIKRMCVKKLPPVLAIQLKRFEYDYEKECAIKYNDYFEFPRDLDMDPYTVSGLAKLEGELIDCDYDELSKDICTKYQLTGIVVHSGQASGGHYYSYILHRLSDGSSKWYKFDDVEVSECKLEEDEEMKSQCFGGDYMGEVFDHMSKRPSVRRQKRWWNAYMLFYTRLDVRNNHPAPSESKSNVIKMPPAIEQGVRRQNIIFMHNRNQFSAEYFQFIKKLVSCAGSSLRNQNDKLTTESGEISMLSVQLASRFLFYTGFHTKKTLRGSANDWFEVLSHHLRHSPAVRNWFAHEVIFDHPHRLCEYLLSCPSGEVRTAFMKMIVLVARFSLQDGPYRPPPMSMSISSKPDRLTDPYATLSDHLLYEVLMLLLDKEASGAGRHMINYFTLFQTYANSGIDERAQLLRLNVAEVFILVALEETPRLGIKYQVPEWMKLLQVVSMLVRCCDVSCKAMSFHAGKPVLPNPYGDPQCPEYIMPVQPAVADLLFGKTNFIKKVIEDPNPSEEIVKLLQFCSWENPDFSSELISESLWQINYVYCQDLKHYLDLLLHLLLMEDSWQTYRIHNALQGVSEHEAKEGLFEIVNNNKNHLQKRAYQCIKYMTTLFSRCKAAYAMLTGTEDIRRKWAQCLEWLQEEIERKPYATNTQYGYNSWSSPTHSNDSNGYFLERSNSARKLLERAMELCPQEEPEAEEVSEEGEGSQSGESAQCFMPALSKRNIRFHRCLPPLVNPQNNYVSQEHESSQSELTKSHSQHSVKDGMLGHEIQDETISETQNGHLLTKEQLVSSQISSTTQKSVDGIEESLGNMNLDEIDHANKSAES